MIAYLSRCVMSNNVLMILLHCILISLLLYVRDVTNTILSIFIVLLIPSDEIGVNTLS